MNLEEMGVQEMKSKKLQETDGGFLIPFILFVGACINDAQNNPDDFQRGWDSAASLY